MSTRPALQPTPPRAAFNQALAIQSALLSPPRSGPVFCDRCDEQVIDCRCEGEKRR